MPHLFSSLLLHVGGADPTGWLWSDWNVEPTIAIGLLALVAGYLYVTKEPADSSPLSLLDGRGAEGEGPSPPWRLLPGVARARRVPEPGFCVNMVAG